MKCEGNPLSRRGFLTVGAVGGLGLNLAALLQMRQAKADLKKYDFVEAKADSVIHVFLPGGMAHQESFDPKPFSPIEYRGEMGTIRTNTGEVVSETTSMPEWDISVLRSLRSTLGRTRRPAASRSAT